MLTLDLLFWGITAGFLGKILLGVTVINVHGHIVKEHHIDMDVLTAMRKEKWFAVSGVVLMIVGYVFEIVYYGYLPF